MRRIITLLCLCIVITANAQLNINENGYVGIGTTETPISPLSVAYQGEPNATMAARGTNTSISAKRIGSYSGWGYGLYATNLNTSGNYNMGVRGEAYTKNTITGGRSYGVFGTAGNTTDGWNYGVFGTIWGERNGAGIYGTTNNDYGIELDNKYAGYFNGNTKIRGDLTVTGNISGIIISNSAPSISSYSYNNISEDSGYSKKISSLSTTQYYIKETNTTNKNSVISDTLNTSISKTSIEQQAINKVHYGLSTEQLKEHFPELVYEKEDGSEGVNYIELIPILISTINELNNRISTLEKANLPKTKSSFKNIDENNPEDINTKAKNSISQNVPNPCKSQTEISCNIEENVSEASIYIYDLTGNLITNLSILERGNITKTIDTSSLTPAVYLYSFICDGKIIETKRMVVSR